MSMATVWEHGLTLSQAANAFMFLLGLSLVLQSLEFMAIARSDRVMVWDLQLDEMPTRPAGLRTVLRIFFQPLVYQALLMLRGVLAVLLMAGAHGLWLSIPLMIIAVLLLFRWRGAFNGGSDFMTLAGLSGLLLSDALAVLIGPETGWRAGLWWVTLQLITSYFMSGWVKLKHHGWRDGSALPLFLDTGIYGPLPDTSLLRQPGVARALSWAFILWEGMFALVFLDVRLAWLGCLTGASFHWMVFRYFGLNRFFWAWLTTYPALIYAVTEWHMSQMY
jgi:hypothetical protein